MPRKDEETNWLDDAFDEDKNVQALKEAQKANNRSCLVTLVVGIAAIAVIMVLGFGAIASLL